MISAGGDEEDRSGIGLLPRVPLVGLVVVLLAVPAGVSAQTTGPGLASPSIAAVRLVGAGITVDGLLDEPVWQDVPWATGFRQRDPDEGEPATLQTEVAFVYDDQALYVGARMSSPGPRSIIAQVSRRDNPGNAERIIVSLDSYHDRRTAYTFGVTASGVRLDYFHPTDSEHRRDFSFDPVWTARTHIGPHGWTAEMRIPFSQLRFNKSDFQVWGLNINRFIPSRNEDDYWIQIPKQETGWSSRMGRLKGISGIAPSRRIEFLPYATSNATVTGNRDPANPFDDGRNVESRAGADVKMGLGPGLTLDATVNPDFGQVDADPAVVNLSAVEIFFPERRPFFTEGAQLLQGQDAGFYYSRRIGAPPPGSATGDYVDSPQAATILGAAKVSGRLPSGTSIGTLVALTGREYARTFAAGTGLQGREQVAPLTGFAVARVQQEFGPAVSTIGATFTGVQRDLDPQGTLATFLNRTAVAGGMDFNLRFQGGKYELGGSAGMSHIRGTREAMLAAQTSSRRYYQRPDQGYVTVDSNRTSLTGYRGSLRFAKRAGRHWLYDANLSAESPGFEINDAGRLGTTDDIDFQGQLRYRETNPGALLRRYDIFANVFAGWNFGGVRQFSGFELKQRFQFLNFWRGSLNLEVFPGAQSDRLTRGGPLMRTPTTWNVEADLSGNRAANTTWDLSFGHDWNDQGGWSFSLEGGLRLRPSPRFELRIDPRFSKVLDQRQYITTQDGNRAEVFNGRYVFGAISRTEISTQLRLNYSFTPDMSLELYAEPFVSSGQYRDLGELRAARTDGLRAYGTDGTTISLDQGTYTVTDGADSFTFSDPNFNVLSFRSNLVLRWEWRPGSTLFLVWQQNKEGLGDPNRRAGLGGFFDSITGTGDNFFAVKVSYWIPVG